MVYCVDAGQLIQRVLNARIFFSWVRSSIDPQVSRWYTVHMTKSKSGFTIVELLIVIVIIAILAAITIVAYNGVQQRARDSARKQDLAILAKAVNLYQVDVGDYAQAGCGNGVGSGWLHNDYDGAAGPNVPINDCLRGNGPHSSHDYLGPVRRDPSGNQSCPGSGAGSGAACHAYIKVSCAAGTWLMANLESLPQDDTVTNGTCNATYDTAYGINYVVKVN